jgi:hypothetical protein
MDDMTQTKLPIFSKEDIEKYGKLYGFEYIDDTTQCKTVKTHYHWGSMDINDGKSTEYYKQYTPEYTEDEIKTDIALLIPFKYVNSIYYLDLKSDVSLYNYYLSLNTAHFDQRVSVCGHTPLSESDWDIRKALMIYKNALKYKK